MAGSNPKRVAGLAAFLTTNQRKRKGKEKEKEKDTQEKDTLKREKESVREKEREKESGEQLRTAVRNLNETSAKPQRNLSETSWMWPRGCGLVTS